MTDIVSDLAGRLSEPELSEPLQAASRALTTLVEDSAYVGEIYSLGYDEALVQIHDFHRQRVGGIPALSFLIATRVGSGALADIRQEDGCRLPCPHKRAGEVLGVARRPIRQKRPADRGQTRRFGGRFGGVGIVS